MGFSSVRWFLIWARLYNKKDTFMESEDTKPALVQIDRSLLEKTTSLVALAADRGAFPIHEFRDVGEHWEQLQRALQARRGPRKGVPIQEDLDR